MHASHTLVWCLKGTPRLTKRLDISFHFSQDAEILPLTATSTQPSHSSSSPRFLKVSTSSSLPSSNSMLSSSLSGTPSPLHLGHTKSLTPVTLRSPEHLLWHHLLHVLHSIEFASLQPHLFHSIRMGICLSATARPAGYFYQRPSLSSSPCLSSVLFFPLHFSI